ncbi:unnamed protein product [Urochloa humidicola]
MAPPLRRQPELVDDAIAEILLRLPPDDPVHLFRASLVCKPWHRVASDPGFLRDYRRFHRTPPLLGFFDSVIPEVPGRFVPTTAASPFSKSKAATASVDCRHGRLLFHKEDTRKLLVWDPITGHREELHDRTVLIKCFSAVVLCAIAGCDHCDCNGGPFLVVSMGMPHEFGTAVVCVYSSRVGKWVASADIVNKETVMHLTRAAVIADEVYFTYSSWGAILKYDLGRNCLSNVDPPELYDRAVALMTTEDDLLGLANTRASTIYFWTRILNAEGVARWVQCSRMIDLWTALPVDKPNNNADFSVVGFAEGINVVFITIYFGTFIIDLKSGQARKVSESVARYDILPVMCFYNPGMVPAL